MEVEGENEPDAIQSIAQHHFDEVETTDRKHIPSMYSCCTVSCRCQMERTDAHSALTTDREEDRKTRHVQIVIIVFGFFSSVFFVVVAVFVVRACSLHVPQPALHTSECLGQTRGARCNMPKFNSIICVRPISDSFGFCIELRFN